ncbi:MAG: PBP1A family penicillin-binding protein [Pseudomonadota bacterium]
MNKDKKTTPSPSVISAILGRLKNDYMEKPPDSRSYNSRHGSSRNEKPGKKTSFRIWRVALTLAGIAAAVGLFIGNEFVSSLNLEASEAGLDQIVTWSPSDNTLILDRNGNIISEEFYTFHKYIPYEEMPKFLIDSLVAIEDRRFFSHKGYDPKGILRAASSYVLKNSKLNQGASTITQQVVRQFTLSKEKTIARKVKEVYLAYQLEKRISKEKILEIYLNHLFLGNGSYGVGSAAKRYFDKELGQLNKAELALIAGLFQSPSAFNPEKNLRGALVRQKQVLNALVNSGKLDLEDKRSIEEIEIQIVPWNGLKVGANRWFSNFVVNEAKRLLKTSHLKNQGYVIKTTLDPHLQENALQAVQDQDAALKIASRAAFGDSNPNKQLEAAFLVVNPENGEIQAMIGSRNAESDFNRTIQSMRSPGSLFKPIIYSLALESGFKWSDVFYVSPINVSGDYRPRNISSDYLSETTMLRAFYRSMNAPTIEISEKLGMERIIAHANSLGISSPIKREFGSALGQSEVNMLELARVYSTFANGGTNIEPIAISKISDRSGATLYEAPPVEMRSTKSISLENSFQIAQAFKKVLQIGTASRASKFSDFAGGKTGTTNDSKDNWFAGLTGSSVAISWVGADEPTAIPGDAQGATLALPIWISFMELTPELNSPLLKEPPRGMYSLFVHPEFGNISKNGIEMWFRENDKPDVNREDLESLSRSDGFARGVGYK